ncbi:hypothetical protein PMIN01_10920 [Paraphaeosphaeria minitans]|uniref:Uncharacterized protein n=1 Tax=Paraphaeosphaeria minitans TaxID=565426 RepID=A0A9P6G8P5_9PLEO|nr:hypothetical protein PMIN01_10920 [Paraphaeosphaeria minitans]
MGPKAESGDPGQRLAMRSARRRGTAPGACPGEAACNCSGSRRTGLEVGSVSQVTLHRLRCMRLRGVSRKWNVASRAGCREKPDQILPPRGPFCGQGLHRFCVRRARWRWPPKPFRRPSCQTQRTSIERGAGGPVWEKSRASASEGSGTEAPAPGRFGMACAASSGEPLLPPHAGDAGGLQNAQMAGQESGHVAVLLRDGQRKESMGSAGSEVM